MGGCCTNGTKPISSFQRKSLFIRKIPTSSRGGPRLLCAVQPDALFVRSVAPSSNRATDSRTKPTRPHGLPRRPSRQKCVGAWNSERGERASMAFPSPRTKVRQPVTPCSQPLGEHDSRQSAACGSPPRRAYRPYGRRGRVAEGGGLLNRYRVVKPYRGFESLRLRQFAVCLSGWASHFVAKAATP